MTEPRKCPEPGCGMDMKFGFPPDRTEDIITGEWHCPRNADAHALCAQLDEAHKREVVLREALEAFDEFFHDERPKGERPCVGCNALAATSESATAWLKAHDREVLEGAMQRMIKCGPLSEQTPEGILSAILGEEEP